MVPSATLEAARLAPRGGGGAPSGRASLWECRAAQSRQARPEEPQGASWGTAKEGTLTVLVHDAPSHTQPCASSLVRSKGRAIGMLGQVQGREPPQPGFSIHAARALLPGEESLRVS